MTAWGYEFYLLVLKVSLTSELRSLVRDTFRYFSRYFSLRVLKFWQHLC